MLGMRGTGLDFARSYAPCPTTFELCRRPAGGEIGHLNRRRRLRASAQADSVKREVHGFVVVCISMRRIDCMLHDSGIFESVFPDISYGYSFETVVVLCAPGINSSLAPIGLSTIGSSSKTFEQMGED